jgi:hypothetical protein
VFLGVVLDGWVVVSEEVGEHEKRLGRLHTILLIVYTLVYLIYPLFTRTKQRHCPNEKPANKIVVLFLDGIDILVRR